MSSSYETDGESGIGVNGIYEVNTKENNKKLYKITAFFVVIGLMFFVVNEHFKKENVKNALKSIGYKDVKDLEIFSSAVVFDKKAHTRGRNYHLEFKSNNKDCYGYIRIEMSKKVISQLKCQ